MVRSRSARRRARPERRRRRIGVPGSALARRAQDRLVRSAGPVADRVRPAYATLTGAGRAVLVLGVAAWVLAWRLGWEEMAVVALTCLLLLGVAALFMLGSTRLAVTTVVEPPRVTVGEALTGELEVRNLARTPLLSAQLEFPIGTGGVAFDLPALLPGAEHAELFVVPTERRGVIPVGPVTTARGDALGLFRREVTWTERTEIFVHPRIVPLAPLGAGLMRDLEGATSQTVSVSDLAFHALREYVPGDDLRHVHWRSSARHGQLQVRQFLDTRRSHLVTVVDGRPTAYAAEQDYETAISVAASLIARGLRDEYDVSFLSGPHQMTRGAGRSALDVCSRAEPTDAGLVEVAARAAQVVGDASAVFLVSGPGTDFLTLQRAASQFPVDVARIAVRVDPSTRPSLRTTGDLPLLSISALEDLPLVLKWGMP